MMGRALLDHHSDPAAQLVIAVLDRQGVLFQQKIEAAANVEQGHVVLGQLPELHEGIRPDRGIVGVNAVDFFGIHRGPIVFGHSRPGSSR